MLPDSQSLILNHTDNLIRKEKEKKERGKHSEKKRKHDEDENQDSRIIIIK